jgi:hypothetical protein
MNPEETYMNSDVNNNVLITATEHKSNKHQNRN